MLRSVPRVFQRTTFRRAIGPGDCWRIRRVIAKYVVSAESDYIQIYANSIWYALCARAATGITQPPYTDTSVLNVKLRKLSVRTYQQGQPFEVLYFGNNWNDLADTYNENKGAEYICHPKDATSFPVLSIYNPLNGRKSVPVDKTNNSLAICDIRLYNGKWKAGAVFEIEYSVMVQT